jgi:hypothetical protein
MLIIITFIFENLIVHLPICLILCVDFLNTTWVARLDYCTVAIIIVEPCMKKMEIVTLFSKDIDKIRDGPQKSSNVMYESKN